MRCSLFMSLQLLAGCAGKVAEPAPTPRAHTAGGLDPSGEIFQLVGGFDASGVQLEAWALDIPHREWVRVDGPSAPLHSASSARLSATMWVFGGTTTADVESSGLVEWGTRAGPWIESTLGSDTPPPRRDATLTQVSDSQAVLIGGYNDDYADAETTFGDVWGLDASSPALTEVTTTDGPSGIRGHAAAFDGERVWVHGGVDDTGTPSAVLWSLDTLTWTWTEHSTPEEAPSARSDHMLAWWDGWLVLWGGTTEDESIWVYDPAAQAWGRVDSTGPSARSGFAWDTVEDDPWAVVIGGATASQDGFLSDVWVLNLDTLTWTEIKRLSDASF